jgi:hypothetical protein
VHEGGMWFFVSIHGPFMTCKFKIYLFFHAREISFPLNILRREFERLVVIQINIDPKLLGIKITLRTTIRLVKIERLIP